VLNDLGGVDSGAAVVETSGQSLVATACEQRGAEQLWAAVERMMWGFGKRSLGRPAQWLEQLSLARA
jgi:hypothetical protein